MKKHNRFSRLRRKLYHLFKNSWYVVQWWNFFLLPFSFIYRAVIFLRRWAYKIGLFKSHTFPIPVIVVGNITVGGTGKTPLVIYLVEKLQEKGFSPAVVSRGYGRKQQGLKCVEADSLASEVGDEPLLIKLRTGCPVVVATNRVEAIQSIVKKTKANIIISDDGLQHYAIARNIEIAVTDGLHRFGNGFLLPAGPLREPLSRLKTVDFIVNNGDDREGEFGMSLTVDQVFHLKNDRPINAENFMGKEVHAIAGIGHPKRFFNTLISMGIKVIPHYFPDHHFYKASDLDFQDDLPLLMTEKDRVKCLHLAKDHMYYLSVKVSLPEEFLEGVIGKLLEQASQFPSRGGVPEGRGG